MITVIQRQLDATDVINALIVIKLFTSLLHEDDLII